MLPATIVPSASRKGGVFPGCRIQIVLSFALTSRIQPKQARCASGIRGNPRLANPRCKATASLRRSPGGSDDSRAQVVAVSPHGAHGDQADPHPRMVLDRIL